VNPPARPDELPRLLTVSSSDSITVVPPDSHPTFANALLETSGLGAATSNDRCGGGGLCGMIPYAVVRAPVAGFSLSSSAGVDLKSSPLF
jgi:hypothetical protein